MIGTTIPCPRGSDFTYILPQKSHKVQVAVGLSQTPSEIGVDAPAPRGQPFLISAASHVAGELMLSDATVPPPTREGPGVRMKDVEGNLLVDIWWLI